jgi:hypothetical protein
MAAVLIGPTTKTTTIFHNIADIVVRLVQSEKYTEI